MSDINPEVEHFLDDAGFAADDAESQSYNERALEDSDEENEEEYVASDESLDAGLPVAEVQELERLRAQVAMMEAQQAQMAARQQAMLRQAQIAELQRLKETLPPDEWDRVEKAMLVKEALAARQQLNSIYEGARYAEQMAAEQDAKQYAVDYVDQQLNGLSDVERHALSLCKTPSDFEDTVRRISDSRNGMTQNARAAFRSRREEVGADRVGGRGMGNRAAARPQFRNIDELVDFVLA